MRKESRYSKLRREKRERKKSKRYHPRIHNLTLAKRKTRTKQKVNASGTISMSNSFICDEFLSSNTEFMNAKRNKNVIISLPKSFDIFKDTESVIEHVIAITKKLMMPGLRNIQVDHRKVVYSSLGSESLLGLLVTEIISNRRSQRKETIDIIGLYPPDGRSSKTLIENIGLAKELSDDHFKDAQDNSHEKQVHYYRKDNRYATNISLKGDNKSITAEECVEYLNSCLDSHGLILTKNAKLRLKACLGEVFDNAEEHCGRSKPVWFARGYFNDTADDRFLELTVFNLGNSFFDNFNNLPESSRIKSTARDYVNRHSNSFDERTLYTVACLQGSVSTKRDSDSTRGHGSVTLIETFEAMYDEYRKLRGEGKDDTKAEMNIISGETIIRFDGKYRSKTDTNAAGNEKFIMAFNEIQSLASPPEKENVYTMSRVKFPGVMINIRIPLKGSTVSLRGEKNE